VTLIHRLEIFSATLAHRHTFTELDSDPFFTVLVVHLLAHLHIVLLTFVTGLSLISREFGDFFIFTFLLSFFLPQGFFGSGFSFFLFFLLAFFHLFPVIFFWVRDGTRLYVLLVEFVYPGNIFEQRLVFLVNRVKRHTCHRRRLSHGRDDQAESCYTSLHKI